MTAGGGSVENRENVKIILLDGSVHAYNERIRVPRNKQTEELYQELLRICELEEDKTLEVAPVQQKKDINKNIHIEHLQHKE